MSLRPPRPASSLPTSRPPVDEWGIYDPSQAGLEALFELLDARRLSGPPEAKSVIASMEEANRRLTAALQADSKRK